MVLSVKDHILFAPGWLYTHNAIGIRDAYDFRYIL